MVILVLGILFFVQQSTEVDNLRYQENNICKLTSFSGTDQVESISFFEILDNEQENNTDSNNTQFQNYDFKYFFTAYVSISSISYSYIPKNFISPLLLDIPPPSFC